MHRKRVTKAALEGDETVDLAGLVGTLKQRELTDEELPSVSRLEERLPKEVEASQATHGWRCMLDEIKLGKWGETKSERMKELSTMDGGER